MSFYDDKIRTNHCQVAKYELANPKINKIEPELHLAVLRQKYREF